MIENNKEIIIKDFEYFLAVLEPDFISMEGLTLLKNHITKEDYERYWKSKDFSDSKRIERTINHVHLEEIIGNTEDQYKLGEALKRIWARKLAEQFPSRSFDISLNKIPNRGWVLELSSDDERKSDN